MPNRSTLTPNPERTAAIVDEAARRIQAAISDYVIDLDALRIVLEIEMTKGPTPLVKLMKVGRSRILNRISRQVRKEARQHRSTSVRLLSRSGSVQGRGDDLGSS